MRSLPSEYFINNDVLFVAQDLLGKELFCDIDGKITSGIIVETEAYRGPEDRGSHAYNNRRTPRNEMMYKAGGVVYMYICYGIHDMLNIVTGPEDFSHAVLIRALEPVSGIEIMRERRNLYTDDSRLCRGPGALAKAMGLNKKHNGISVSGDQLWIEERPKPPSDAIKTGPRIGLNFEGPFKEIAWRFYIKNNPNVTRPNK